MSPNCCLLFAQKNVVKSGSVKSSRGRPHFLSKSEGFSKQESFLLDICNTIIQHLFYFEIVPLDMEAAVTGLLHAISNGCSIASCLQCCCCFPLPCVFPSPPVGGAAAPPAPYFPGPWLFYMNFSYK